MGRQTSLFISDEFTVAENTVTVPVSNQAANDTSAFRTFFARKDVLQCQNVCTQRSVCVALILATGILSAYFIHQSTANREEAIFTSQFENLAYILGENFLNTFETKVWTSFSISLTLTSESEHYNKTWPYVMIPYFEQRFQGNREIAKCQNIFFAPLVTDDTRTNWEKFVIQNQDQISVFPDGPSCQMDCPTLTDGILMPLQNESRIQDPGPGPYLPVIFITTNDTNTGNRLIMTNLYHSDAMVKLYNTAIFNGTSVLSDMQKRDTSPASILITPVFDGISNARKAVGILQVDIEWRTNFEPVASPLDGSVVVVLQTGLEEVVSFEILGREVIFLGEGDHHDQKYSRYGVTSGISTENLKDESKLRLSMWRNALFKYGIVKDFNSTYTGRFAYNITFYPTESLEFGIKTNLPVVYSVATSIIFLFVIIIFTAFDKLIDTRKKLEKDASNAPSPLLSTLIRTFPQNRLMENDLNASRQLPQRWATMSRRMSNDEAIRVTEPAKSRLRAFLNRSENTNRAEMEQYQFEDPIADLFPETTIMFADISGFTAWSSEREPSQIFYLLETLYRAFDQLASELGVFKVETIGDCYVAVTGLPDPNKASLLDIKF
jgi:Adenylate and Guanylate cyclase catalytic domain